MDIETGEEMAKKSKKTIGKKPRTKKSTDICAICRNRIATFIKPSKKKRTVKKNTGCGKSSFIQNILFKPLTYGTVEWDTVLLCYGAEQPMYDDWYKHSKTFVYHRGWPDESVVERYLKNDGKNLLIFDDLEESVIKNPKASNQLMKLFTVYRHHWGVSVIWVTHHLFSKHDSNTCIQRNTQYLVLMSSPRDKMAISKLGSQIDVGYGTFLLSAYKKAVEKAGDFLLLDLRPDTPEKYRVRETITKEGCIVLYEKKKKDAS